MLKEAIRWYKHGELPARELPRVAFRRLQARVKPYLYTLQHHFPNLVVSSSQSDRIEYNRICRKAVEDERVFNTFKRHPDYRPVLEHVTQAQGQAYLDIIRQEYPHLLVAMDGFRGNDRYGSPITFEYEGIGTISPTTLRYIKILGDIQRAFGPLDDMEIIEIGAGYGGQAKIISDVFPYKAYTVVDLTQALRLLEKYLSALAVPNILYRKQEGLGDAKYDLCISNYAFSECSKVVQDWYIESVLRYSARGYITFNASSSASTLGRPWTPYNGEELLERLRPYHDISIAPERPQTGHKANHVVLTWGT